MDKRQLHHLWTRVRRVKVWHLLVLFVVSATTCALALRTNNLQMVRLREAVYTADKTGGNVEQALQELRAYVGQHMNTSLTGGNTSVYPPIQLKYTYERLREAERQRVDAVNARIYPDAQNYCEQLYPGSVSGGPRIPCIENYVATHGTRAQPVADSLYKFNFMSSSWSPDLAGWALVCSLLFLCLAVLRFWAGVWAKRFL